MSVAIVGIDANPGYKGRWLVCRTIVYSPPVLKKPARRKLFRPSRLVGSYVSPFLFGPGK
ncbi:MAG: hypothetical protein GY906_26915 [bacterium]|nr:hypothetical protein [bacterium]